MIVFVEFNAVFECGVHWLVAVSCTVWCSEVQSIQGVCTEGMLVEWSGQ